MLAWDSARKTGDNRGDQTRGGGCDGPWSNRRVQGGLLPILTLEAPTESSDGYPWGTRLTKRQRCVRQAHASKTEYESLQLRSGKRPPAWARNLAGG